MTFTSIDFKVKTKNGLVMSIIRSDGACIPPDPGNADYRQFVEIDTDRNLCVRDEIPDPVISTDPTLQEQIDAIVELLGV